MLMSDFDRLKMSLNLTTWLLTYVNTNDTEACDAKRQPRLQQVPDLV